MARTPGPSLTSLAQRGAVSLWLIVRAALLWLRVTLHGRGLWRSTEAALSERERRFARDFVRAATRFRGALIKLGQVASHRLEVEGLGFLVELLRFEGLCGRCRSLRLDPGELSGALTRPRGAGRR